MKKIFLAILAVVAVISASSFGVTANNQPEKIIAYYFHGSFRCATCINMEKYSREAIDVNFKNDFASGKLEFKAVNLDEQGNEHFVEDYNLYTKSLILSLVKDGREIKSKNLDKIWEYAHNKQKFIDYVTGELNEFMKGER
ncbi:MAG: nitrophenyl compound nitroreductase subunit ArsF family protein [Candidatus Omnitrophica bacterium]|nr:nitrophenyl compound nitroreductase subunit ArsF family protein [Candidatus Omnitrophota bacterium]